MSFLNPIYLFGLLAAGIPIIIHLIRLHQREKLAFPTIAFLEELKKSTIKKLNIKKNLLLALRILALSVLAIALGRPLISGHTTGFFHSPRPVLYGLLIDNSPSMNQINEHGPYIDQGKQAIRQIARNARRQDRFILMKTNGKTGNFSLMTGTRLLKELNHISVENTGSYLNDRLQGMQHIIQRNDKDYDTALFWFTDGQRSMVDSLNSLKKQDADSNIDIWTVVRIGSKSSDNVAITDIKIPQTATVKSGNIGIMAYVKNFGSHNVQNEFVSLVSKGTVLGQYPLNLNPNERKKYTFQIPVNTRRDIRGVIEVEGDPFTFDNKRYFSLAVPDRKRVLIINGNNNDSYISSAVSAVSNQDTTLHIDFALLKNWPNNRLQQYNAIIINGLSELPAFMTNDLKSFIRQGHDLIVIPSEKPDINSYNKFLGEMDAGKINGIRGSFGQFSEVARIRKPEDLRQPLFAGMFEKETKTFQYPALFYYYLLQPSGNDNILMRSNLQDPLFIDSHYGKGRVIVSAFGFTPEWSDLPTSTFFAPLMYRLISFATYSPVNNMATLTLGSRFRWLLPFQTNDVEIRYNGKIIRPKLKTVNGGTLLSYDISDWVPGWAVIHASHEKKIISVNQNIMESDFTTLNDKTLHKRLNLLGIKNRMLDLNSTNTHDAALVLASNSDGRELWNVFIWIGLILLLAETAISRWYEVETV